jgi:hypothetical protein
VHVLPRTACRNRFLVPGDACLRGTAFGYEPVRKLGKMKKVAHRYWCSNLLEISRQYTVGIACMKRHKSTRCQSRDSGRGQAITKVIGSSNGRHCSSMLLRYDLFRSDLRDCASREPESEQTDQASGMFRRSTKTSNSESRGRGSKT